MTTNLEAPPPSSSPDDRWQLLGIPSVQEDELVIVCCDGCTKHPEFVAKVEEASAQMTDKVALLSLPPLLTDSSPSTSLRYKKANARIALSGCQDNCAAKLLQTLPLAIKEQITPPEADRDTTIQQIIEQCRQSIPHQGLSPSLSMFPPAAQVQPKGFRATWAPTPASQTKQRGESFFERSSTQSTPTNNQQTRGYFAQPKRSRSVQIPMWLVALVAGAGVVWGISGLFRSNTPTTNTPNTHTKRANPLALRPVPRPHTRLPAMTRGTTQPKHRQTPLPRLPQQPIQRPTKPTPRQPKQPRYSSAELARTRRFHRNWIGGVCTTSSACPSNQGVCLKQLWGGMCSQLCQRRCPQRRNKLSTYCVQLESIRRNYPHLPSFRFGLCLVACDKRTFPKTGCRVGTTCKIMPLRKRRGQYHQVCVPVSHRTTNQTTPHE